MDLKMTLKKIAEVEAAIRRDLSEEEKTDGLIRRYQDKKKMLEARVKKNEELLSDLKNRKTVLTIEEQIGTMDESKLSLLKNPANTVVQRIHRNHGDIYIDCSLL